MLIPYNTDATIYHWPLATVGLIAPNVAVFIAAPQYMPKRQVDPLAPGATAGLSRSARGCRMRCRLAKLRLAKLLEIAVNDFENLGMLFQYLADCLVPVAILTYDLAWLPHVVRPEIKNRFGFPSYRCPP